MQYCYTISCLDVNVAKLPIGYFFVKKMVHGSKKVENHCFRRLLPKRLTHDGKVTAAKIFFVVKSLVFLTLGLFFF